MPAQSWRKGYLFDSLHEGVPHRIPRLKEKIVLGWRKSKSIDGAVLPVWITVRTSKDIAPGLYEGSVTVEAGGLGKTVIPLRCRVHAWNLPDPGDFLIKNLAVLAPESLARHYKVPLWSERHFELMAKSMRMMFDTGSRRIEIDLAIDYHGSPGNSQTLVRWIKKPDGTFDHDFSVLDKFLDVVEKTIGKPHPLRLNCWGEFSSGKKKLWNDLAKYISVLDPDTGKLTRYEQPIPGTPESIKLWKPVFDAIRERARKRGWDDVLSVAHQSYCTPPPPESVDALHRMWPEAVWSFTSHNCTLGAVFKGKKARMPVHYGACVWTAGKLAHRGYKRLLARIDKPHIWTTANRMWYTDQSPVFQFRRLGEDVIMRGHNGLGQMGADLFPIDGGKGRYYHLNYNRGGLGPAFSTRCILAPGKDGPIATERYEMFREGMQLAETILRMQQALDTERINGDLARRVNACLDRRSSAYMGGYWEGQLARDRELYELASEIEMPLVSVK